MIWPRCWWEVYSPKQRQQTDIHPISLLHAIFTAKQYSPSISERVQNRRGAQETGKDSPGQTPWSTQAIYYPPSITCKNLWCCGSYSSPFFLLADVILIHQAPEAGYSWVKLQHLGRGLGFIPDHFRHQCCETLCISWSLYRQQEQGILSPLGQVLSYPWDMPTAGQRSGLDMSIYSEADGWLVKVWTY